MKALLKILSINDCHINLIPPFHTPKKDQIVLCKQFQEDFQIYKIVKVWTGHFFDLEVLSSNEFRTYNTILSVPFSELHQIFCEYVDGKTLFKIPLCPEDYEYGLSKIGQDFLLIKMESEVEIEFKFHKDLEDDIMDGIWNYPMGKIKR